MQLVQDILNIELKIKFSNLQALLPQGRTKEPIKSRRKKSSNMKTLFALLVMSSTALCQQPQDWTVRFVPERRQWPVEPEVPPRKWKDYRIDIEGMAHAFAPMAYQPRSYMEYMASPDAPPNPSNMHLQMQSQMPGNQPVRLRDSQGRVTGTLSVRPNGEVTVRDNRGRVSTTATVRAGAISQRRPPSASTKKPK